MSLPLPAKSLYDRLGGVEAVRAVVDEFYKRLVADPKLAKFFADANVGKLKIHQLQFLKVAFTEIPNDMDIVGIMIEKHEALFRDKGLNADHFDIVASHLVGACKHLGVSDEMVQEAAAIVVPLRVAFEQGAALHGGNTKEGA
ncbi:hypothetical protein FisN_4Hh247 [Fistulifera solaris]|jgi:hemoglobin|uniref:Globin family profile domain-containing protein n=1 Tax=Fistulifera solaris TaxID=1519565 RepID=A0A1Z5KEK7_FISSO|nr:hypothetical protein FisN_4Hh247 [Fistulifera solaris]|eukprot:GAX24689.1 hypothetical protein FisN_4Hh247 [Fistulifera solaris]